MVGLGMALGPLPGGLLVEEVGWRSIFWINIPVGLAAIVLTALLVQGTACPPSRPGWPVAGDPCAGRAGLRPHRGARPRLDVRGYARLLRGGCAALLGLIAYEPCHEEPLIDVR